MVRLDSYDQHFLRNRRLVAELVGHSNIRKNDTVVDLGAGSGVIASVLAGRAKQVTAIEIEPVALSKLRQNMSDVSNVTIIEADILDVKLPTTDYKVFSNIPFSISADVVRRLTDEELAPKSIYLIVQKQFAQKLIASDRNFTSQLGAEIAPWWQARIRRPLRRTDFTPPPAVDTVLLELKPRQESLLDARERPDYRAFIASCFGRQKVFSAMPREQAGIASERKPSEVSPEQWVRLYNLTRTS